MANLPQYRINPGGSPFEVTSIDFFGPVLLRFGRTARKKGYGVVLTCLNTKAVHVDLASDLSTETFLLALRRFVSLFGHPNLIISDNGSN